MYMLDNIVSCGGYDFNVILPNAVSTVINIIKIVVPIIIIVLGMLDLAKAVMANEEKEMKEAQGKLIKRIIYGALVFFVIALVQFVFSALSKNAKTDDATGCISCFTSGTTCTGNSCTCK